MSFFRTLTRLTASLALAAGVAVPAHAAPVPSVFFVEMAFSDGLDTQGGFYDTFTDVGTEFDDYFLFYSPPVDSQVTFDAFADQVPVGLSYRPSVSFTAIDFGVWGGGSLPLLDKFRSRYSLGGTSADYLGSGVYYIEIQGITTLANGGYFGDVYTSAIPEPGETALMLAGLAAVGVAARRRQKQAA